MCAESSDENPADNAEGLTFEELQLTVKAEFEIKASFLEHGIPTFYINYTKDSKEAFLGLIKRLEPWKLVPLLRQSEDEKVVQILPKPATPPNNNKINIALFFATLGTVFFSGYWYSASILDALLFTGAIMAILGSHEMGHKLFADKHDVDATYPYFIPGLPPIGTFGAVIRQKELPPNKDALFDIGFMGPMTGFIIAVIVIGIGLQLPVQVIQNSEVTGVPVEDLYPLLYRFMVMLFPPTAPEGVTIVPHPVVSAGLVGLLVTMLNLVPAGMFDGGHITRSILGDKWHRFASYAGVALLALAGWWPMAVLALFFASAKHPGPLDDVSELTTSRKVGAVVLLVVFVLSFSVSGVTI